MTNVKPFFQNGKLTSTVKIPCRIIACSTKCLRMILKLRNNIDLLYIKNDLKEKLARSHYNKNYPFEVLLIYKIIHEWSNYEDFQWRLYSYPQHQVEKEMKALLIQISKLDKSLTWDCMSIYSRYSNIYRERAEISNKYLRS